jgi:hypothetical protein
VILTIALLGLQQGDRLTSPVLNANEIAGPWETAAGSGIEGIYINVDTAATQSDSGSAQTPPWQTVKVNVYKRRGGETTNGWFVAEYKSPADQAGADTSAAAAPGNPALSFSNNHLRIVLASDAEIAPLDIDVTFSPAKRVWTGTWKTSGKTMAVSLTPPKAAQRTGADPIVGDWKGRDQQSDAKTTICIRRSADDVLTAWMNRDLTVRAMDVLGTKASRVGEVRSAELLQVVSFDKDELHLETANAANGNYEYIGKLSADGNSLTGSWQSGGGGGTLNAQQDFHRVAQ